MLTCPKVCRCSVSPRGHDETCLCGRIILHSWIMLFLMKQAPEMKVLSRTGARQSPEAMTDPVKITAFGNCERQVF